MRRQRTIKGLFALLLGLVLISLSVLPTRLSHEVFACDEYEGQRNVIVHREQHGLPFPFVVRSMSISSCSSLSSPDYGKYAPDTVSQLRLIMPKADHMPDDGFVILLSLVLDIVIWTSIAFIVLLAISHWIQPNRLLLFNNKNSNV